MFKIFATFIAKTYKLICSKQIYASIFLDGKMSETVQNFTYLRSKITSDGYSNIDIINRIVQTKAVFYKKKTLFTTNVVSP